MERTQARAATLMTAMAACIAACVAIEVGPVDLAQATTGSSLPVVAWQVVGDTSAPDVTKVVASVLQLSMDLQMPAF